MVVHAGLSFLALVDTAAGSGRGPSPPSGVTLFATDRGGEIELYAQPASTGAASSSTPYTPIEAFPLRATRTPVLNNTPLNYIAGAATATPYSFLADDPVSLRLHTDVEEVEDNTDLERGILERGQRQIPTPRGQMIGAKRILALPVLDQTPRNHQHPGYLLPGAVASSEDQVEIPRGLFVAQEEAGSEAPGAASGERQTTGSLGQQDEENPPPGSKKSRHSSSDNSICESHEEHGSGSLQGLKRLRRALQSMIPGPQKDPGRSEEPVPDGPQGKKRQKAAKKGGLRSKLGRAFRITPR